MLESAVRLWKKFEAEAMALKKKTKAKTAKKAAVKKSVAKKAPAKKAPAKKAPAKKVSAKKAPAKKAAAKKPSGEAVVTSEAEVPKQAPAAAPAPKAAVKSAGHKVAGRLKVTLIKSVHGRLAAHKACAIGLGLRRRHQSVEVEDTPCTRGMINRIRYLLEVEGQ